MPNVRSKVRHTIGRTLRSAPAPVQDALRRAGTSLVAGLRQAPDARFAPASEVPLPDGLSLAALGRTFRSWSVGNEPVGHLDAYVDDSIGRFLFTWGLVRDENGSCLELGANPYFTTYLLDHHTSMSLTLANYYGSSGKTTEVVSFVPPGASQRTEVARDSDLFNVEEEDFPYESGSFDVVLFCEIIEHMLMNPLATLGQIHRVLKPNGIMVLTTPNVARLGNVLAMVNGANIYDPYSGFGPYGRHNREYNRHELHRLLAFAGFEVEQSFTADAHAWSAADWPYHQEVLPLVGFRGSDLGQYLFVKARAARPPREGLPSFLYRSWPPERIVDYS
jgi:SAM-dependent methyltransferase